jgi:hypothetical protein
MIPLSHLWLAIIGSAVAVFVVSSLLHMLFTYHNSDYKPFSNEDDVRAAINKGGAGAGMYVLPYCPDMKGMREPAMIKKMTEGPTGFVLLRAPGAPKMGPSLTQWFGLTLALSFLAAYVASLTIAPGTARMLVLRIVSAVAFLGYAGVQAQNSIWRAEPWGSTFKNIIDGLIYSLVTGAVFAVTWPAA